jgi:hypothetical protein
MQTAYSVVLQLSPSFHNGHLALCNIYRSVDGSVMIFHVPYPSGFFRNGHMDKLWPVTISGRPNLIDSVLILEMFSTFFYYFRVKIFFSLVYCYLKRLCIEFMWISLEVTKSMTIPSA